MIDLKESSLSELITQFKELLATKTVQEIKEDTNQIKSLFYLQYNQLIDEERKAFVENGGEEEGFESVNATIQQEFKALWKQYIDTKNEYHQKIATEQQDNLTKKEAIIEQIKAMVEDNQVGDNYKQFKALNDEWKALGSVPVDKYKELWGNYHFYVEKYYDLLHMSNDLRSLDFKHNLEAKQQIILKAKQLTEHHDVNFAFNELQVLHKIWKEETGPVAKEYREPVWEEFCAVSNEVRQKKEVYYQELRKVEEANYQEKVTVLQALRSYDFSKNTSFSDWKKSMDAYDGLKEQFLAIGKVPKTKTKTVWEDFKEATKAFNSAKNDFFKGAKEEQQKNVEAKKALIQTALDNQQNDNIEEAINIYKRIQADWKKTGHVPKKVADKMWNEFQQACNFFFDRLKVIKTEGTPEQQENLKIKEAFLAELQSGDITKENIDEVLKTWLNIGEVPNQKTKIDQEIKKHIVDQIKKDSNIEAFDSFKVKANAMAITGARKVNGEIDNYRKKIDTLVKDTKQLENNLGFVSGKGKSNPLLDMVNTSIANNNAEIEMLKKEFNYIKKLLQ